MGRFRKTPLPAVGEAFAVAIGGGRFAVCRVVAVNETGDMFLVANADWFGTQVPDAKDSSLRSILRLTHHKWSGQPCAVWVRGAPPVDFVPLGSMQPLAGEDAIDAPGHSSWGYLSDMPWRQWLWDHPEETPLPPPPPKGQFILHRFNGDEVYRLESAVILACETTQSVVLWFEAKADPRNAQRCEDTAQDGMSPNAEVAIDLPDLNADELVGREFNIPGTRTDEEDSCRSLLSYFEHESLRDNCIKVLSREGDRFWLRWTARVRDVNFGDDDTPQTQVEIEGEFVFKNIQRWTGA